MTCTYDFRKPFGPPCAHCEAVGQKIIRQIAGYPDEEYDDLRADGFRTVQERQLSEEVERRRTE